MTAITIGPWTFDHASYDAESDVAYLSIGAPQRAVGEETPEGHVARFSEETGEFCGLTLVAVSEIMDGSGPVTITIPSPPQEVQANRHGLEGLVCA